MIRALLVLLMLGGSGPALAQTSCPASYVGGRAPAVINPNLKTRLREVCYPRYAVGHSGLLRVPIWSAERMTAERAAEALATSGGDYDFAAEPALAPSERAELSDYKSSGFDRGHLTPSGNFATTEDDQATFTLANVVPQHACLNQRTWRKMEESLLKRAAKTPEIFVVTGPLYEGAQLATLKNQNRVFVPTSTYKAIYIPGKGAGVYVATNPMTRAEVPRWSVISVAELAARAGLDVFPALSPATKSKVLALKLPKEPKKACKVGR
jgi:endonuclease G